MSGDKATEFVKVPIKVKCWKDKATGSWIMYSQRLEISSYGRTKKQAREMFVFSVTEILLLTKKKWLSTKK